jgi:hypothetical protein
MFHVHRPPHGHALGMIERTGIVFLAADRDPFEQWTARGAVKFGPVANFVGSGFGIRVCFGAQVREADASAGAGSLIRSAISARSSAERRRLPVAQTFIRLARRACRRSSR